MVLRRRCLLLFQGDPAAQSLLVYCVFTLTKRVGITCRQNSMRSLRSEIDRMIEKGGDYSFAGMQQADRGWVFCPEYAGASPLEISPAGWDTRIFLFGPGLLPDSDFRRESIARPPKEQAGTQPVRFGAAEA